MLVKQFYKYTQQGYLILFNLICQKLALIRDTNYNIV